MLRSISIIVLALICGAAAAIGVTQTLQSQVPPDQAKIATQEVLVAASRISRGQAVTESMVTKVDWPADLLPSGVATSSGAVIGRVAVSTIMAQEPFFESKLSDNKGQGFIASIIKPGMRAYTIQTRGPSASVAGFIRPQDHVDVLVNLRGKSTDETGGGSTTTLLQSVMILAIDRILDPNPDPLKLLEMWSKGDSLTSVTLEVTPAQASLLALGQSYGELSLSLRNSTDDRAVESQSATVHDIRFLEVAPQPDAVAEAPADARTIQPVKEVPQPIPVTFIQTLRGTQSGRIELTARP